MKRVKLNAYQVGLVFKDGAYRRLLVTGTYWFWRNEQVYVYDITNQFIPPVELNILLQDERLADLLQVIEVKDNEIALQYENGLLKRVLSPGRYAYWKSLVKQEFIKADISKIDITENIDRSLLSKTPLNTWVRMSEVQNYEKALLFVEARYVKVLEPGAYYWWKNSITIHVARVDMRQQQLEINGQEILTKDKAALRINAWAKYKVADIEKAVLLIKEYDKQLYITLQLALREYVARYTFDELLEKKDSIAPMVLQAVKEATTDLGVVVSDFGIRDIILPGDVKEIMTQVLIAEKKAQANTIMRREETASTRSLLNTAKLMEENAMLWKLKEMEYVEKIADKINSISIGGNGQLLEQLKQILINK
jgi:hypothetical protein